MMNAAVTLSSLARSPAWLAVMDGKLNTGRQPAPVQLDDHMPSAIIAPVRVPNANHDLASAGRRQLSSARFQAAGNAPRRKCTDHNCE